MFWPGWEPLSPSGCSMGWVQLPPTSRDTEDPGGDAASGVALCPPQPLTLQPAPGGRTALGTSLRPLTTLADKGSSPLGVGTGQPGSGVTENSAPAWSDSQLFLAGDGTGVTAKTPWEKGCHWGNYLPSSWHIWAGSQECQLSPGLFLAATVAKRGEKTEMCRFNRSETQSAPITPARWH